MTVIERVAATIESDADRAAFIEFIEAGNALDAYEDGAPSRNPEYRYRKACEAWHATDTYRNRLPRHHRQYHRPRQGSRTSLNQNLPIERLGDFLCVDT
ncbi:hypothetical protein PBI_GAIA_181 [Mycobacterium phage Gaia]|uniref:Uncharacterized protein n=1 Tax=Mycobacterium phage Gaia TaxID=1486472 RepID=A0A068F216_9CAUD|nr:hypothetical protein VC46_gp055 [Mycobacterium phage Gaia]AID58997.1 hypothetical protein PBI_GAIA_181 [Mycobacterium phage Gaia]AYR00105.1 hypothetical protein PBI_NEBKISS_176 [Mycobacterium phage Nebkiss]